jgi:polygalacturonase
MHIQHIQLFTQIIKNGINFSFKAIDSDSSNFAQIFQVLLVFATIVARNQWATVWGMYCEDLTASVERPHSASITDFGAVGDGVTLNTKAFQNALFYLNSFAKKGGAQLFVPAGRWLTGSFSLISHLTLSLDKDAVILGSPVR